MNHPPKDLWLDWSKRLQAIAQNGLTFTKDPYDIERYQNLRDLAAEMLAAGSHQDLSLIRDWLARDSGYMTPKVDVRGVVFHDNKLLLVRERSDGKWTLPGGWADICASPAENVVREVREESGYETRATKLLAVFDRSKHPHHPPLPFHVYKMFFQCAIIGGSPASSSETDGVDFFSEANLPELSIDRVTPGHIKRLFEHHRHPQWPTDFDDAVR
jgi:ADP-ribose pyrophosphatase YjhB (NUDIX family)